MTITGGGRCRSCSARAVATVLDIGMQPVADDLLDDVASATRAPRHPLALGACRTCGLVQLDPTTPPLPNASHGHGSAFSGTVLDHESRWAEELLDLPALARRARVLDVGSGAGNLLRPFQDAGHEVSGWERDGRLAAQAIAAGIPTTQVDGNRERGSGRYDLVLANHTLSHADDLDGAVETLSEALAPGGTLALEFHSALGILLGGQFDVICHAHRSYLSLTSLATALQRHGLAVSHVQPLALHGGVLRLLAGPAESHHPDDSVARQLAAERDAGLGTERAWAPVAQRAANVRDRLAGLLAAHRRAGRTAAGYGAPSRGTTLLNYCGVDATEIPRTADRSPMKQGRYLPGAATRICAPDELAVDRPDVLLVLVWPLRDEVLAQLAELRSAGTRFVFPLPEVEEVR